MKTLQALVLLAALLQAAFCDLQLPLTGQEPEEWHSKFASGAVKNERPLIGEQQAAEVWSDF